MRARRVLAFAVALALLPANSGAQDASAVPVAGDLTNLIFTATGSLPSAFVSPKDGSSVKEGAPLEVSTVAGAGVEVVVNGERIPFSQIGERMVGKSDGETHYVYYGIAFKAGANDIAITALGAGSARGPTKHATVYGPGTVASLQGTLRGNLRATGTPAAFIHVTVLDRWLHPAAPQGLRATVVSGDVTLGSRGAALIPPPSPKPAPSRSADLLTTPSSPLPVPVPLPSSSLVPPVPSPSPSGAIARGTLSAPQYEARTGDDGTLDIPVLAGLTSGNAVVKLDAGNGLTSLVKFFVRPYLRKALVTGLVTGGIGSIPGVPGADPRAPDGLNSERARVALFGSGKVLSSALLTFAYDTANVLDQTTAYGPFTSNPDERPYLTYGDASVRRDDALSRNHLYARLEQGTTNLMYGEFVAKTGSESDSSIGGLNLLVNGLKLETSAGAAHAMLFEARNDVAYGRQTFTPTGLGALSANLHTDIVVGSEIVDLVTFDRHTGLVIAEASLTPNVDYTLDYGSGELLFINVPLPFDATFDPQQILVRYQYQGVGDNAETSGGRVSTSFGRGAGYRLGVGYANSSQGSGNVTLLSEDLGGTFTGGSWGVEHMATRGQIGTADPFATTGSGSAQSFGAGGDAWRAALAATLRGNKLAFEYETTSAGYDNPFGGLATPGLVSYRGSFSRTIRGGTLTASFDRERNAGVGFENSQTNASAAIKKQIGRKLTAGFGLALHSYGAGTSFVGVPAAGQDVNAVPTPVPVPVAATANGISSYANPDGSVTQADLNLDYKLSPALDVKVSRLWDVAGSADAVASQPSETAAELGLVLGTKGRAYVREMWNGAPSEVFAASSVPLTTQTQSTRSLALGFERSLGNATTVDSEYVLQNSANGSDVYAAIGAKEAFALRKNLKGSLNVQRANATGSGLSGFNIYGLSAVYSNVGAFKATASYELRTGDASGSTLSLGAVGALNSSVSLVASVADVNSVGFTTYEDRVSLAIRPAHNDRSITLFGFDREIGNSAELGTRTETLSLEESLRPSRVLQISGRLAYKLDGDPYYAAKTYLLSVRAVQKIGGPRSRFDVGFEDRYLGAGAGIVGQNAYGYALETGATVGDTTRLAVGYNFAAAPDPNLAVVQTRKGFYATCTLVIDSVLGWGKH